MTVKSKLSAVRKCLTPRIKFWGSIATLVAAVFSIAVAWVKLDGPTVAFTGGVEDSIEEALQPIAASIQANAAGIILVSQNVQDNELSRLYDRLERLRDELTEVRYQREHGNDSLEKAKEEGRLIGRIDVTSRQIDNLEK